MRCRLSLLLSLAATPLVAQVPYNGCVDRAGVTIIASVHNEIGAGAIATRENDKPVIQWNQGSLQWTRPATQLFVYLHECGHHALGHLYKPTAARWEREADCWAMELLVDGGMLGPEDEGALRHDLARMFPGDGLHLPGEAALRDMQGCMHSRTDKRQWRVALDSLVAGIPDSLHALVGQRMPEVPEVRHESLLDLPGVFDCEILPGDIFRCPLYATPSARMAEGRYKDVMRIIQEWLPTTWSSVEQRPGTYILRQFVAEDGMTGARITLALTDHKQVFFLFQPHTE
ncbi:MAG TPA: hypothetical protein VF454_02100 [Gemmatimonadales bacterium]